MAQAFRNDEPRSEDTAALEERLRTSLRDARGNLEIRHQLVRLARDPERVESLRRQLGGGHALLRELRELVPDRAGGEAHAPTRVGPS